MRDRVRRRFTYADVMSTIAVFAVLGGTSYAAITITVPQVKTVRSPGPTSGTRR